MTPSRSLQLLWLGRTAYGPSLSLQRQLVDARRVSPLSSPAAPFDADVVLALEHPPTYTVGRRTVDDVVEGARLRALGAEYFETLRGGQVTFHGPGQLVVYPIISLRRYGLGVRTYVEALQGALMDTCAHYGVATQLTNDVGVWVGNDKIAAIGVQVSAGYTSHGVALNCTTDLTWFSHIVPCGLVGKGVTSLVHAARLPADQVQPERVLPVFAQALATRIRAPLVPAAAPVEEYVRAQLRAATQDLAV